jgi:putative DNA-invertase from lambdoid prophage Rac
MISYSNINIQSLDTVDQCYAAIEKIEHTANSYTSPSAFRRGAHCELNKGASNKIKAINKRADKLFDAWELKQ